MQVWLGGAAVALWGTWQPSSSAAPLAQSGRPLRAPSAFASIADPAQRSMALFEEAGKVFQHPRCVNCHPAGDRPLQGEDGPHQPLGEARRRWVRAWPDALHDVSSGATSIAAGVPGQPKWHVAPSEMAWQGKTLGEICAQIKDPARNGGHTSTRS